jgi:hypothetical protein
VWKSTLEGKTLHFHLTGINNQNFIMKDEETGSWWQQVSGRALQGPLKGKQLEPLPWDEVSFAVWTAEHPQTLVLLPDEEYRALYAKPDWEKRIEQYPVVTPAAPGDPLRSRALVVGIQSGGAAKAYPFDLVVAQNPVNDSVGGTPVALVVGEDGRSLRCFERVIDGQTLELFRKPDVEPLTLLDAQTGSEWDFTGRAVSGPLTGRQLKRLQPLKDYWFDWKNYHPQTRVYTAGQLKPAS